MSQISDAFSGTSSSGVNDQTFSDANLGDAMTGGSGDLFGGGSGGGGFNAFNDIANALSGGAAGVGATPQAVQSASMTPPSAAGASGGDPTGAASGTQSATSPGSTPTNQNQQQQSGQNNQPQDHAPPDAVAELRTLLKGLAGKPTGPTGQLPTVSKGETGPQSPPILPGLTPGETGPQSPMQTSTDVLRNAAAQLVGAAPAEARTSPDAATEPSRDITVQKPAPPQGMPPPQNEPGEVAPGGPALPTKKPTQPEAEQPESPQAAPQPTPLPPRILQDIAGTSTGAPTGLAELAQVAMMVLPLLMGGGGRRGRGGFRGMGGFRPFGARGGFHPTRGGHAWPYHHPQFGWHMHGGHPGPGWLPLNPSDAQALVGGGQGGQQGGQGGQDPNAPDPNRPPKEGGRGGGSYSDPVAGPWSGNSVYNTLVGAESGGRNDGAPGQPAGGDGGIARGYFNIQTPTWHDFAQKVPGASQYQTADQAPYEIQRAVANTIPVARFGDRTRRILHSKFGNFDERTTVGQLADQKGGNNSRAAQLPPAQIPVTSQPMVAGPG